MKITFFIDGNEITLDVEPTRRLLDVIREELNITGVKEGCGQGECGACSVFLDGKLVNSCMVPMIKVQGSSVITIQGFSKTERYKVLEQAFIDAGAVQCGFCTPGMILASEALLTNVANPNDVDIRKGISGNLCRCTGYNMIIDAIKLAKKRGRDLW
ncbi:(2Fe-2S)-binding protein [Oceanirhabdus sp. W0125-5]|uniref:(2Fe-2S)-binding protein n=1 Tax=Oceanirhabdus sp. W0125-5 TaxID=2999116 RepID=UPI0022F3046B|nr:(2Fe-2S)-binding protein [Oceanirhabdus sp. W0125-5]WBW95090.1 (2Fe-2S)-binding protein [Oceanirhabdus sp. W0125-5]